MNLLIPPNPDSGNSRQDNRPLIMGVLNVTPDSFSDGGEWESTEDAVERALQMVEEGADIIDIGGESTRPPGAAYGSGAERVSFGEEWQRVGRVIEFVRRHDRDTPISIDTQKSDIAELALEEGANIINDVSAGTSDPEMFRVAANRRAPMILMHGHGPRFQKSRLEEYVYDDVVSEVRDYLADRIRAARAAGVYDLYADVGIGFAKIYRDNLRLLKHHDTFSSLGVTMVIGVSRKSTIGLAMGGNIPTKERLTGSIAAACYAAQHGASIIRTHDVKQTREAIAVIEAIRNS
jgi:dihydropteroate synthase